MARIVLHAATLLAESAALIARSAELCTTFRRHIAGGVDLNTPSVIEALGNGPACLACLVGTTGLREATIVDSLRRLSADVIVTVGPCPRCSDDEDRLLCVLPSTSG